MATISSSASLTPNAEKPSFAKIAAAGLQTAKPHANPNAIAPTVQGPESHLAHPHDPAAIPSSHANDPTQRIPKPRRLVQIASQDTKDASLSSSIGPSHVVQKVEGVARRAEDSSSDTLLLSVGPDDNGTQISSESGSFKPPSLDGKSFASATTFALDEKESLRPDDSASVKAVEDDEFYSHHGSGLPGSRIGSDTGVRAFHDQLREISSMEPTRRAVVAPVMANVPKGVLYVPPQGPGIGVIPNAVLPSSQTDPNAGVAPDSKLLEALDSPRDRIWVLKLEQDIIDFVKDAKESSLNLPQCNSFYRMLAHKIADYYMLGHMVDDSSAAVRLYKTPNCRIPPPLTGITTPSTATSTPPPSAPHMKILRRGMGSAGGPAIANGSNLPSKTTSENGDSSNDEDKKAKLPVSREEREARYEAARLRIMGSAKPDDSPDASKEKQDSRSSSATGKKYRRKARGDSDDDFDSRSAYSNFYTTPFGSEALSPSHFGFSEFVQSPGGQFAPRPYESHSQLHAMQTVPMPASNHASWPNPPYQSLDPSFTWPPSQQSPYELTTDFRSMSFQNQASMPSQAQSSFGPQYGQQYYGSQQTWQSQSYQMPTTTTQASPPFHQTFPPASGPSPSSIQDSQPYAFGQLPSQAYPGRAPSKMEHPLPGSYKGKHFNPQSQAFIPGNGTTSNMRPFTPQGVPPSNPYFTSAFGPASQLQSPSSGSPHQASSPSFQQRVQPQPMTHPLPQPVFARQPSPNAPLPPKPGRGLSSSIQQGTSTLSPGAIQRPQDQSVVAKWGTPASLPAKPPPSTEMFDASRLAQTTRPPFAGSAGIPRVPNGSSPLPTPSDVNGGVAIVNGTGQTGKRA